ncbi:Multidrug resistance protein NorM [compost metagenome]
MTIAKLAPPLIVSRLGELVASFLLLAFIGNLLPDSMAEASFAWAFTSFITVIGIGLFSIFLIEIAAIHDTSTEKLASLFATGILLALTCGMVIVFTVFVYMVISNGSIRQSPTSQQTLLTISLAVPAIYCQIVAFNFYNAQGKPKYELIYVWVTNAIFIITSLTYMHHRPTITLIDFTLSYVALRWLSVGLFIFFIIHFELRSYRFWRFKKEPYRPINLFLNGLPLALCFGAESFLYFALSLTSKNLGDEALATYQISIHFLSVIYMISIGVGNAASILVARNNKNNHSTLARSVLTEAGLVGSLFIAPCLLICLLLPHQVARLYTTNQHVASMVAEAIQLSIPFLIFELCYVLTRMVLRSIGDAWVPTALTITCLNGGGLVLTWLLFSFYQPSIKSIIFALTGCTLILMTCLLVRFFKITGSRHRALFNQ